MKLKLFVGILFLSCQICMGSLEELQDAIRDSDLNRVSEVCSSLQLTENQQSSMIAYAREIATERGSKISSRKQKIIIATVIKGLSLLGMPTSPAVLAFLVGSVLDPRGLGSIGAVSLIGSGLVWINTFLDIAQLGKRSKFFYMVDRLEGDWQPQGCIRAARHIAIGTAVISAGLFALDYYAFKCSSKQKKLLEDQFDAALRIVHYLEMLPVQD
jgi:hypothetical protein